MKPLVVFIMLLLGMPVAGQTPDQTFGRANQAYQQGKYREALEGYEQLRAGGYGGATLYYNLGNAFYKTGDIAHAVLYYERARRLAPDDDDLLHNLQLANLMVTDRIEPAPQLFLAEWWDGVKAALSLNGISVVLGVLFALTMGSLTGMALARSYRARRSWFLSALGGGILTLASGGILWAKVADLQRTDEAIVTAPITTIKNSPDATSSDAFVLHAGVKIRITDTVQKWWKIRLADGKVGWMEQGAAEPI